MTLAARQTLLLAALFALSFACVEKAAPLSTRMFWRVSVSSALADRR